MALDTMTGTPSRVRCGASTPAPVLVGSTDRPGHHRTRRSADAAQRRPVPASSHRRTPDHPVQRSSARRTVAAFSGPALAAGIRGVLSYQLFTNRGGAGALNLFSRSVGAIDPEGEAIGAVLATHAAGVMMAVDRRQEFQSALATRDVIGQAKGIVMNQFSVDAVRAFELMVCQSQDTNTPVRVIAQQIVDVYAGSDEPPQ